MSFTNALVIATCLSATLSGCTRSQRAVEVTPQRQPATQTPPERTGQGATIDGTASIPVTLKEADFKGYGDTTKMNYKFTYLGQSRDGALAFAGGVAQIALTGLPAGQSGQMVLDVYEGAALKVHGAKDNVTLTAGVNNDIDLHLAAATGADGVNPGAGTGSTTDLTIAVTLESGAGSASASGSSPGSGGNGSGGAASGTGSIAHGGGTSSGSASDPLADWDGKSFRGNAKWNIVPVAG